MIIPAYIKTVEELEWFEECLASVVDQSNEIIVWDDMSPIDVVPVCNEYPGTRVFRDGTNRGPSAARNSAARKAAGPLLFPLDSDDRVVDGALRTLVEMWDGRPIYTDIFKFGDVDVPHYELLDWCDHIVEKVGIATVSVLHSRDQWESIGGWNTGINVYEDGEYNARLFLTHCATHVKRPLVGYRIHENQRSRKIATPKQIGTDILTSIRQYVRRIGDMACCGKRRTPSSVAPETVAAAKPSSTQANQKAQLPGAADDGSVHAKYIGGMGKGKHYYRGVVTKFAYRVRCGDILNADPRDCDENEVVGRSKLIALAPLPKEEAKVTAPVTTRASRRSPYRRAVA